MCVVRGPLAIALHMWITEYANVSTFSSLAQMLVTEMYDPGINAHR